MEESCIPSNIQSETTMHIVVSDTMNNAFRDKSKDHKSKHYWFRYLLGQGLNNHNLISLSPYPREISQATMMAGSSRWQSAVIGGNGAWRARMRTMNPKSNRTCLYSRSRRHVMRLSNKRSPYLFGVATANRTKVTTLNKYGVEIIARMSDWENRTSDRGPVYPI